MLTKTELKKTLSENGICPLKRFGQNFLIDKNIKDKIMEKADIKKDDFVLEIGPGLGALTEDIAKKAGRVVAVEKDRKLCAILKKLLRDYKNITIVESDILKLEFEDTFLQEFLNVGKCPQKFKLKVIGNLPYYITSPIIFHVLRFREHIKSILITVQKEVAQRIVARPGTKDYSPLSLSILFYAKPALETIIKKAAFFPRPDVDSRLVSLEIRDRPAVSVRDEKLLFEIIRTSFGQRRKMLANSLKGKCPHKFLTRRPETLSLDEFASIANRLNT